MAKRSKTTGKAAAPKVSGDGKKGSGWSERRKVDPNPLGWRNDAARDPLGWSS